LAHEVIGEQCLGLLVAEGTNHDSNLYTESRYAVNSAAFLARFPIYRLRLRRGESPLASQSAMSATDSSRSSLLSENNGIRPASYLSFLSFHTPLPLSIVGAMSPLCSRFLRANPTSARHAFSPVGVNLF